MLFASTKLTRFCNFETKGEKLYKGKCLYIIDLQYVKFHLLRKARNLLACQVHRNYLYLTSKPKLPLT